MFGIRVLIILIGIALVVWILIRLARGSSLQQKNDAPQRVGEMVRCETCGVFTPRVEAIEDDGRFYCSRAHQLEDPDDHRDGN